ncbi:MAG: DNA cytosine methyltransferase [Oscillospiraceae bacterium]|nr:DNA cytosine methyltransferase [Oscillospiraceae bacterium]
MKQYTLGSLFDGIGAFPLGASFFDVKTLWASEILTGAVSVTRRHFPDMAHVGDITKLNGATLPPVDIVTFGSPCQDLSQANSKRTGLTGERSGLFMEAIRIIDEMRKSTNGNFPKYAIWENVPGAFSSGTPRGSDFRAVLEAFAKTDISMPDSGRWATAGLVRSGRANIAWTVYNAADFGLAQRRKRCFVVADFGKGRPEEILLVPKSLCWCPPQGGQAGESVTAAAENSTGSTEQRVFGICSMNSNSMKSDNPHSGIYEADTARTLDTNGGNACCNQGGMIVASFNGGAAPKSNIAYSEKFVPTLRAGPGSTMTPYICEPVILSDQGGERLNVEKCGLSPTLRCKTHGHLPVVCTKCRRLPSVTMRIRAGCEGGGKGALCQFEKSGTLATGNDQTLFCPVHPKIAGTLCGSGAGLSRPAGMASETDLTVAYCLQGNMIGRDDKNGPAGSGVNAEVCYTLNGTDRPAVAFDCRNLKDVGELSGTLQSKTTPGYSLNYQNPVHNGYVVRRLTPTECERLMGFPDGYTKYGCDGKEISDSKRYSMLGNSIAVPCVAYIMQGIMEQLFGYEVKNGS